MRVAYLVHFRGGRETGIYRKVREHVTQWTRLGVEVGLFVGTDRAGFDDWSAIHETRRVALLPEHPATTLAAREGLSRSLRRWRPDVVYARHGLVYPGLLLVARSAPTVLEINSDDVAEFRLTSASRAAYNRATRSLLLRSAAGFVFVTEELKASPWFARFKKPSVAIGNGIDLHAFPTLEAPANDDARLVFVGHARSPWHGVDHMIELARCCPSWRFDLVGLGIDETTSKPENVTVHGTLLKEQYLSVLRSADVAVGTLALYRNGMTEASPLKVREYLARGIPSIIGYRDTDFPDGAPFLLRVPNDPGGIVRSIAAIEAFVSQSRGNRVPAASIAHLDVRVKEERRVTFLEQVAGHGR
jgi:hypothetical protein